VAKCKGDAVEIFKKL